MIIVRTACSLCGEIAVPLSQMRLYRNTGSKTDYFAFDCPECGKVRGGEADAQFVNFLVAQGLSAEEERFAPEILELHEGPPLDYDDLLDFHKMLEETEWFEALQQSVEAA